MKHLLLTTTPLRQHARLCRRHQEKHHPHRRQAQPRPRPSMSTTLASSSSKSALKKAQARQVNITSHLNAEWPTTEELDKADTILIYSDGGGGHPALQGDHLQQLDKQMKRGCGFVCVHYAVETHHREGQQKSSSTGSAAPSRSTGASTPTGMPTSPSSPSTSSAAASSPSPPTTSGISTCASVRT